ncbi:unnamed protein product [Dibothriocephalus latus]|uniref:Copine C-terminal domain-containing protein n=1 Tax=Dibothriocephalus latus TaxID=60516 RepID=A0A3P6VBN1_DIBLA|nr:unnamed protein product [Dibothriocephalus latus]
MRCRKKHPIAHLYFGYFKIVYIVIIFGFKASRLPISIIIVGVGSADFSAMEELDGDDVRLTSRGQRAERDIVQFVPFDDFCGYESLLELKRELARAVLAEIPDQLISYMRSKSIKPRTMSRTRGLSSTQDHPPPYPASAPPYPLY